MYSGVDICVDVLFTVGHVTTRVGILMYDESCTPKSRRFSVEIDQLIEGSTRLLNCSVAPCRPQAGVVHCGRGHQSAAEPQTRPRRVLTEAPAQLLPDKRQLHPPEPAGQRELPPLQCHGHRPLDGRRAGNLL